jgi:hypothetical protein
MAEWIAAISAVSLVLGGGIAAFVSIRTDIARLQVTVHSIDLECAKNVAQITHLENLFLRVIATRERHNGGV